MDPIHEINSQFGLLYITRYTYAANADKLA